MILSPSNRGQILISIQKRTNKIKNAGGGGGGSHFLYTDVPLDLVGFLSCQIYDRGGKFALGYVNGWYNW